MKQPLISVIIPVYNVEKYLEKCLNSVLSNTYKNLQIIVVNDGSTDNSGSICDVYAEKDNRITVIHQENKGLSSARNAGLAAATGKYIGFVDSDDMISPVMYEELLWAITNTAADIAACEYTREEDTCDSELDLSPQILRIVNGRDNCVGVYLNMPSTRTITWTGPMVWNKLYLREKITFPFKKQCEPAEDLYFNWEYSMSCNKMVIVPKRLYYWQINPQSITQTPTVEKTISIANVLMDIAEKTPDADIPFQNHLQHKAASNAHIAMWKLFSEKKEEEHTLFISQARDTISFYYRELVQHEDTQFRVKVFYILYRYFYPLWKLAARLYGWQKRK